MDDLTDELSPRKKGDKLTPEILRKYPGCEHYTDEQAINTVQTIEKLAEILFEIVSKKALKDEFKQLYK